MKIADLIPTHNRLRSPNNLEFFLKNQINPIALSEIDGKLYVHDGHHRLIAYLLDGIQELDDTFFSILKTTKSAYLEINPEVGWVTPFDIETECRLPEFFNFKRTVLECWNFGFDIQHFFEDGTRYKEPRKIYSMAELAEQYRDYHLYSGLILKND